MQLNPAERSLHLKLVYYGPGLSGKTTNLQILHAQVAEAQRGRLMTLATADDRTLFFDLLPLTFQSAGGLTVKIKLYTVPGQVMHNSTRKIVLAGADGVAFIADSRPSARAQNYAYWQNLEENLRANGMKLAEVPCVIQFNKSDLADAGVNEEIARLRIQRPEPIFTAVAVRGEGVVETFRGLMERTYDALDQRLQLGGKLGLKRAELLEAIALALPVPARLAG